MRVTKSTTYDSLFDRVSCCFFDIKKLGANDYLRHVETRQEFFSHARLIEFLTQNKK